MTDAPSVWNRINTVCASSPYQYVQSREPFGLELQPDSESPKVFYVGMELLDTEGLIGWQQVERWEVRIGLARRSGDNMTAVYRTLLTDVHSLTATMARESGVQEFDFEDDGFEVVVAEPAVEDAFVVGELTGVANFERAL